MNKSHIRGTTVEMKRPISLKSNTWWNAKASHMNAALPAKWFRQRELVFMLEIVQRYQKQANS